MTNNPVIVEVEGFLGQFKTASGAITALGGIVGILGTVGVLSTDWTTGLKALLSAVAFLVVLATGGKAAQMASNRAAARAKRPVG